jgi:hypothetical protein
LRYAATAVADRDPTPDAGSLAPPMLAKVRKLLALATSPNPHEAALAAAQAQRLVEAHRLQAWLDADRRVADDPDPIVDARDAPLERSRRIRPWKVALASVLADANGCVAYVLDAGDTASLVLVGRARDRAAVAELWGDLVRRIEWLSATHGAGKSRRWHEAFRIGVVDAIDRELVAIPEAMRAELPEGALVVVDPARVAHREALDRFVDTHLGLARGRSRSVDAAGYRRGRASGFRP